MYRIAEGVILQKPGEESVVPDTRPGRYPGLNATATQILEILHSSANLDRLARALARDFDVGCAAADARQALDALPERGTLEIPENLAPYTRLAPGQGASTRTDLQRG